MCYSVWATPSGGATFRLSKRRGDRQAERSFIDNQEVTGRDYVCVCVCVCLCVCVCNLYIGGTYIECECVCV